jgi:formylmethanofuran dehydrogenase subunit C
MIILHPLSHFKYPVIAECISPSVFQELTLDEIKTLSVWEGNKQKALSELFSIEEAKNKDDDENSNVLIIGDFAKVRKIGSGMNSGEITVDGNVGMHLGQQMQGGSIHVKGNAGSWVGSMMKGGTIEISGDAGDYVAAPYRGSTVGMKGGRIIVHGSVATEAGAYMQRGIIKIFGNAGQFAGFRMHDGTINVKGDCEDRVGACMRNGKIIIQGRLASVLPTFSVDAVRRKVKIDEEDEAEGPLYMFVGDLVEDGRGKLYVSKMMNPHLNTYERFI